MRFLIQCLLFSVILSITALPVRAKPDVLPVLGARYRFYLATPIDTNKINEMGLAATYEFDNELGQTEHQLLSNKMPHQRITAQIQVTKDIKIIAMNQTHKPPDAGSLDNAVYVLKKNEVVGYLIMEYIFDHMQYPEQLLGPIRQMTPLPNYLSQILGSTIQAQQTGLTVYETHHQGFIERYFLKNDSIAIEGFYPAELDVTLRPYLVKYLQAQYLNH